MAGKRSAKRHRRHTCKRRFRKIGSRRNQRGGLIPLPLLALGAGLLTPMVADGVKMLMNRLNI